jgi:hypothetical protein
MSQGRPERPSVESAATKPVVVIDNAARLSLPVNVLLLAPRLGVMLSPALWLAATATPAPRAAADTPLAATQVVAGLGLWAALFMGPARRLWQRCGGQRSVRIAGGMVTVRDGAILGARAWRGPLNAFGGIDHRVRCSRSGVRAGRRPLLSRWRSLPPHPYPLRIGPRWPPRRRHQPQRSVG